MELDRDGSRSSAGDEAAGGAAADDSAASLPYEKHRHALGYIEALPRPTQHSLDRYYQFQYYRPGITATYQAEYTADELSQKRLRAAASNEAIIQSLGRGGAISLLDLGCGEGFLLTDAIERGWSA